MYNTLFLSEENLKKNSIINDNVEMSLVAPVIQLVQDQYLQPILGTALYRDLQKKIVNNDVSEDYKKLLDNYIRPILVYGTISEATVSLAYKLTNLTFGKTGGENIQSATLKEIKFIRNENKNRAQWYLSRLNDFLEHNKEKYPKFTESEHPDILPTFRPYTGGLYLGPKTKTTKGPGSTTVSSEEITLIVDGGNA